MKIVVKNKKFLVLVTVVFFFSGTFFLLLGNPFVVQDKPATGSTPGLVSMISKITLILGLIIVLIYGSLFLLKRFVYQKRPGAAQGAIQVLALTPIAPKKSLCVARIVDRLVVLGLTESGMSLILEISDPNEFQHWLGQFDGTSGAKNPSFANQLQILLGGAKK